MASRKKGMVVITRSAIVLLLALFFLSCDITPKGHTHDDVVQIGVAKGNGKWYGSGFFLLKRGILFTAYHVVTGYQSLDGIDVNTKDGTEIVYQTGVMNIVAHNIENDISILRVPTSDSPELFLEPCSGTSIGDAVTIVGYPGPDLIEQETTGFVLDYSEDGIYIMTDAEVFYGYSGGPIINDTRNCAAGMVTEMYLATFEGFGPSIVPIIGMYYQFPEMVGGE